MSSSTISINCGQAGSQLALEYWGQILQEHQLDNQGRYHGTRDYELERIGVNFSETQEKRYVPRAVHVDLEPGTIDVMKGSALGQLFKPDAYIAGSSGAGNNWAKGHYTEGAELVDQVTDVLRKEIAQAENCDLLQGFQMLHSLAGGTGSGLGTLILNRLREEFPDRMLATYSIMPSSGIGSDTVTEPYNTVLALHQLIETADCTFTYDNDALYKISIDQLKRPNPSFADLNRLIGQAMCGATSSLRFPGQLNGDLRKMSVNLVPFPRLHFFTTAFAPFSSEGGKSHQATKVSDLAMQLFNPTNQMVACDPRLGKYLTGSVAFRGHDLSAYDVEEAMTSIQEKNIDYFANFANNISTSLCDVPAPGIKLSATMIGNNTSYKELLSRTVEQFSAMFKRRAFVHWYAAEGMDDMEFSEACSNVEDLIAEYQQYEADEPDEEYEEEYLLPEHEEEL